MFGSEKDNAKGYRVRRALKYTAALTDLFKRAVVLLSPNTQRNNILFNLHFLMSNNVPMTDVITKSYRLTKDLLKYQKTYSKVAEAVLNKDAKALRKYSTELKKSPIDKYYKMGFIQDVSHDISLDNNRDKNAIVNKIKELAESTPEKYHLSETSQDIINNMIGGDGSKTFMVAGNIMKMGDYVSRILAYEAGATQEEALNMFVDYRRFNPLIIEYANAYGQIPFAIWMYRMVHPITKVAIEKPITTLGAWMFAGAMVDASDSALYKGSVSPVDALAGMPEDAMEGGIFSQDIKSFIPAYWKQIF